MPPPPRLGDDRGLPRDGESSEPSKERRGEERLVKEGGEGGAPPGLPARARKFVLAAMSAPGAGTCDIKRRPHGAGLAQARTPLACAPVCWSEEGSCLRGYLHHGTAALLRTTNQTVCTCL